MYHVHHYLGRAPDPLTGQIRHVISEETVATLVTPDDIDDFYAQVRDTQTEPLEYLIYWKDDWEIEPRARRAAIARTNGRGNVRASSTTIKT